MSEQNGFHPAPRTYVVRFVGRAEANFLDLLATAPDAGQAEAMRLAMRLILDRLQQTPNESGEHNYTLHGLQLRVRTFAVRPLVVSYGVHFELPVVFIRSVQRLPTLADVT